VLSRRGEAHPLSIDHKPILYDEAQRIIRAGGFVRDNRINGALNVSRTIGDLDFKRNAELPHTEQMVVATPDVERVALQGGDEFLILACDGIWDVLTNQEAVDFVRRRLKQRLPLQAICEAMCDRCLATDLKGACRGADNMSVIVVVFRRHADLGSVWGRLAGLFRRRTA
jgi:protein phosphatase 1G